MWWLIILRWTLVVIILFLGVVGLWAIVTITRMKREQAIAIGLLNALVARSGLKAAVDEIQRHAVGPDE